MDAFMISRHRRSLLAMRTLHRCCERNVLGDGRQQPVRRSRSSCGSIRRSSATVWLRAHPTGMKGLSKDNRAESRVTIVLFNLTPFA